MNIFFAFVLIFFAVLSRLIPHAPNFTPVISVALFAGTYLKKPLAFTIPIAALLISDAIIGFYGSLMLFVYGCLALITVLGFMMKGGVSVGTVAGFSLAGSVCFFVVTNFGVWALPNSMYPKTLTGLAECYVMAIPFFRNTIFSTLIYSAALFGAYELGERYVWRAKAA
ncbi:MAG: DUF6580 family putative transport protein [Candidatus Jorgensenbacteria bacterium]